jgi:hypothetical protein
VAVPDPDTAGLSPRFDNLTLSRPPHAAG